MCHRLATSYGRWPHEVLTLSPWQTAFAILCQRAAALAQQRQVAELGLVFPVVPIE